VELHTVPLEIDSQYIVICHGLKDAYGNAMDTARSHAPFRVTRIQDTARAEMIVFGPRKVNGEPEKIGQDRLIPSRGLGIYYPRLLTDSTLADLKTRLVVKADTVPVPVNLIRANHHEFAVMLPKTKLAGQRLQFGLIPYPDSIKSAKPALPIPVAFANFTLADSTKLGTLKFQQQSSAFGSHLVLRSLSSPSEFSHLSSNSGEFLWDSLPEGWYALDYFRDANGDGIWNPGSLAPWNVQEPYVMWMDSIEVKPGGISSGSGASTRKLAWPPEW
jgi:hypothetical protein